MSRILDEYFEKCIKLEKLKIARNLLKSFPEFSNKQIAEMVNLTEEEIKEARKELDDEEDIS